MAMLDELQWHHPLVHHYATETPHSRRQPNCTTDPSGQLHCVPGCEGTRLKRAILSGYNADTNHLAVKLLYGLYLNTPFQAAPVRMGHRLIPPLWDGALGWSYTYGTCPSNFLDCVFLDHSPCPKINIEIEEGPGNALANSSRWADINHAHMPDSIDWYHEAVAYKVDTPRQSVDGFLGMPAAQSVYAYLFRPRYFIRVEVNKRVEAFGMVPRSCAIMHVRRGDSGT